MASGQRTIPAMSSEPAEFLTALSFVLRPDIEGGYVNNPADPGGETNMGITARTYRRYCRAHDLPIKPIRELAFADVKPIYYEGYWKPWCVGVEFPLCVMAFDCAVNMGPGRAKKYLATATGMHDYARLRWERYLERVKEHPPSIEFLPGWCQRLRKVLRFTGYPPLILLDEALPLARAKAKAYKTKTPG